jgi:hypothetical protein
VLKVPWVSGRRERQVRPRLPGRKLVHRKFAEEDGSGVIQCSGDSGVLAGDPIDENIGVRGCGNAIGGKEVLETDRNTMKRTSVDPCCHLCVGSSRLLHCQMSRHMDEAVQFAVNRGDETEA